MAHNFFMLHELYIFLLCARFGAFSACLRRARFSSKKSFETRNQLRFFFVFVAFACFHFLPSTSINYEYWLLLSSPWVMSKEEGTLVERWMAGVHWPIESMRDNVAFVTINGVLRRQLKVHHRRRLSYRLIKVKTSIKIIFLRTSRLRNSRKFHDKHKRFSLNL